MQSVLFTLGEKTFAVDALAVQEILKYPQTTPLPQSPAHVLGMTDFRGSSIPVIHLGQMLNTESAERGARAIVLQNDELCAAFVVDDVTDVLEIRADVLDAVPAAISSATFVPSAVARLNDRLVVVIDPLKLLTQCQQ